MIAMSEAKSKSKSKIKFKTRTKSSSKSKRSSPRMYEMDGLPQFVQPPKLSHNSSPERPLHRPKSEIVRELQRLRAQPLATDEDDEEPMMTTLSTLPPAPAQPLRTLEQLDALRLTRHRIEQLLACGTFEQVVRNCFVRLNINAASVPPEHRIAEIMEVTELNEGYYVDKTATNIALQLRYEDVVTRHELTDISNMAFTRCEFEFWRDNCICQGIEWPTTELLARKKIELYNALNSEGKITALLKQNGLLPLAMPMRPVPRGGLLERLGGVYPWKLQRPPPPPPPLPPSPELAVAATGSEPSNGESVKPEIDVQPPEETTMPSAEPKEPVEDQ